MHTNRESRFRADCRGVRLVHDGDVVFEELPLRRGGDYYDDDVMARQNSSTRIPDRGDDTGVPGIRLVFDLIPARRGPKT